MKFNIHIYVIMLLLIFLLGCKENKWIHIKPGYNYTITDTNRDKEDIFHLVDAHYILKSENTILISKDSLDFFDNMFLLNNDLRKWKVDLPKGISGSIKINIDSFYISTMNFLPITIYLLENHSFSDFIKDTIWIKKQKFCTYFHYVSKIEALKFWKENGGEDMTEFTGENILPESFEIEIPFNQHLYDIGSVERLLKINLKTFSSINYPKAIYNSRIAFENKNLQLDFRN